MIHNLYLLFLFSENEDAEGEENGVADDVTAVADQLENVAVNDGKEAG